MEFVSKWHPNRMGMVDFWYYTNEEFHFDHGHMLLRGSNGSGKSVTMQSFIPLLLDGNKSSERLDPFGTRSRKIENYLLEEEGGRDDRIGYLYLEFKREESDTYKTIGMGLHARKGKPLDTWYFVIEDNRRIGVDIQLMQNDLAISRQSLKNLIQEQLYTSQKVYCEKVNQALFGFERIEEYKEAIDLLLQLRSPKLSNSLKPSMLNEILKPDQTTTVLLETMSGKGSEVGKSFEELREIIDKVELSDHLGVCLDTCHIWDAGYDIADHLDDVILEFDRIIGLDRLKAIHLNDSLNPLGAHKDRHARLGEGHIGLPALKRFINHPALAHLPFYLETPNDLDGYAKEIQLMREAWNY